jgi:hypothetical protein
LLTGSPRLAGGAIMMRRFCLPLLSIFKTLIGPISPLRETCVPPQGCRSTAVSASPMRISRSRCAPGRLHRHCAHQAGIGIQHRFVHPFDPHRMIGLDQGVQAGLDCFPRRREGQVEVEPGLLRADRSAGDAVVDGKRPSPSSGPAPTCCFVRTSTEQVCTSRDTIIQKRRLGA